MFHFWNAFTHYLRDRSGAYAVNTALIFSTLFLAAHVGIGSLRVQNSVTGAEQLVDIACQKIQAADPAAFPTVENLQANVEKQMASRSIAGTNAVDGKVTIEWSPADTSYVKALDGTNNSNVDFRRHNFAVRYDGTVRGLHRDIAADGKAAVKLAKPCRPTCPGMTNLIYSNAIAVGHWMDNHVLKVAQYVDASNTVINRFMNVEYVGNYANPPRPGDRLVITIMSVDARIRYRKIVNPNDNFYLDGDKIKSPGEPAGRATKRFDLDDTDQIYIQLLNADGSLPGMCGDEKPMEDCTGAGCAPPPKGTDCRDKSCLPMPDYICTFPEKLPNLDAPFSNLPSLKFETVSVKFIYPKGDLLGSLNVKFINQEFSIVLAPNYVRNDTLAPSVRFANGVVKTLPREVASAYNFGARSRWAIRQYSNQFFLVHLAGSWWTYWWDGKDGCIRTRSPVVFDTKNLGEIITTRSTGPAQSNRDPLFDYFGHGEKARVEWPIGDGQAWLVDNRDGRAAMDMNGKRFFGDAEGHDDGYAKLRELDTSGTGILRGRDLEGLALWFDNGNAIVEEGELRSLSEVGITEIDANGTIQTLDDGREVLRARAVLNGRTIMTEDVFVMVTTPAQRIERSALP